MFQKHDSRIQVLRMSELNKEKVKKIHKQDNKGKTPKSEIVCYNCNQKGHYSNECPEPKKSSSNKKVHYVGDAGTVGNDASKTKSTATPRNINRFNQNNIYADLIHSTVTPLQLLNNLLWYTIPWLATGACRSAESFSTIPRSQTALSPSSYANAHAAKL